MSKRKRINKLRLTIFILILIFIIAIGAGCGLLAGFVRNLPTWDPKKFANEATSFVYDYKGNYIGKLHETEDRVPVEYKNIPKNLVNAFLAIEDRRFFEHHGVSIPDLARAAYVDLTKGGAAQGGSTITQQLVKNAILENRQKTYKRKIQEALLAIQVERQYTKEEILTFYLNEIYFGHGAYGVQSASQIYFGKDVKDLTIAECAMLAGIVRNPRGYSPYLNPVNAKQRRQLVLSNMYKYQFITMSQLKSASSESFNLKTLKEQRKTSYPWFMDYVVDQAESLLQQRGIDTTLLYTGGLKIYTTLNPKIQTAAEKAFADKDNFPESKTSDPVQGAMVVMEPQTGAIRALVGGREFVTKKGLNRVNVRQQPGSAIKPIAVYAPALDNGYSPASVLDDIPASFGTSANPYAPQNYDGRYHGIISIRAAIKDSVNIPAVKLLNEIGVSTGFSYASKMGLTLGKDDKNLALALGGLYKGVTPIEMATAYTTLANAGKKSNSVVITKITDAKGNIIIENTPKSEKVLTPETAYLMTDMLRTVVNSGTGTRAQIPGYLVAGKTGTTQLDPKIYEGIRGNKDAWFCGYTPELVAVVWQGYDKALDKNKKPQYQYKTYGGNYPAKIFKSVLTVGLKEYPKETITKPSSIVYMSVDSKSGLIPSSYTPSNFIVSEIFDKKNLPTKSSDIWVPAIIDPETHQLATNACPQRVSRILMKRKEAWDSHAPEDAYLELPRKYCELHKGDPATAISPSPVSPSGGKPNNGAFPPEGQQNQQPIPPDVTSPPTSGDNVITDPTVIEKTY